MKYSCGSVLLGLRTKAALHLLWRARLHEVRKLILERDPETMKVLDAIKFLAERKNLITPPVFPKDPDPPSSRRAGA